MHTRVSCSLVFVIAAAACGAPPTGVATPTAPTKDSAPAAAPANVERTTHALGEYVSDDYSRPEKYKGFVDKVKALGNVWTQATGIFGQVSQGVEIGQKVLEALGILEQRNPNEQFDLIHDHLNQMQSQLHWDILDGDRGGKASDAFANFATLSQTVDYNLKHPDTPMPVLFSDYQASYAAIVEASKDKYFQRAWDAKYDSVNGNSLLHNIRYTASHFVGDPYFKKPASGSVYDWRLGVPDLMNLVGIRMMIIAGMDPTFRTDGTFKSEFLKWREVLLTHYNKMQAGIICGHWRISYDMTGDGYDDDVFNLACTEEYSGISATVDMLNTMPPVSLDHCVEYTYDDSQVAIVPVTNQECARRAQQDAEDAFVAERLNEVRRGVYKQMPMFELRSMIDALGLFSIPGAVDLTGSVHQIALSARADLCLDAPSNNSALGTALQIDTCTGAAGQNWVYNRDNGQIFNPSLGQCLNVQGGSDTRGTRVLTWWCHGGDNQRWTYDPITKVLENRLGTVLDVQWGNLNPLTPVWTWDRWEGAAQFWQ